jgi:preprotein translocase subunit SecE
VKLRWPKKAAPLAATAIVLGTVPVVALGSTVYFIGYSIFRSVFRRHHKE